MRRLLIAATTVCVAVCCLAPAARADIKETERVSKTVPIAPGGELTLKNFSGHVTITASDRSDVSIEAVRLATRSRLDRIRLDIQSDGKHVDIDANKHVTDWSEHNNNVVETDFDIQVPRTVSLDIHVFSSPVTVTGVAGDISLESFSGRMLLTDVGGKLDVQTFSGDVRIHAASSVTAPEIEVETFSGNVEASVSDSARAEIDFTTFSGDLDSAMPLMFKGKSKRSLRATLNAPDGAPNRLRFHTFSGDIQLVR
jgi:DUF4097 and DUF4098 domain-containing protein YvlB